ncbi:MAG: formyl-CoA transferase, partial [Burkholderia sp.]|nr:formyl-CoA transferase [Burkholderia sp.]
IFCDAFGLSAMKTDPRLQSNNLRVQAREWMMPLLRTEMARYGAAELSAMFEAHGLPFAPIARPHDLLDDPHLNQTGGLAPITLPDGRTTRTPLLPFTLGGARPGVRLNPPRLGEHSEALLRELGYGDAAIADLQRRHIVG